MGKTGHRVGFIQITLTENICFGRDLLHLKVDISNCIYIYIYIYIYIRAVNRLKNVIAINRMIVMS